MHNCRDNVDRTLELADGIKVHMKRNQFFNILKVQHSEDTFPKFARPKCPVTWPDDVVLWTRLGVE